ncbi:hypothetical protein HU200_036686 [Digitaria exilis]|uniref:Uncharacterized protein n=1 Tax=Digitaria exilis TaxID=1010633 RepID=A0A835EL45_9POAL|nr:hypothetical protein HU200_036686 [Digitaria exilis]
MYMTSPSPPHAAGMTPAPIDTASSARSTRQSAAPHSRRAAYPHPLPLQYARHTFSSTSFLPPPPPPPLAAAALGRSHSSAMRTRPEAISRTSEAVGAASSSSRAGHARGSTWNASVPVSRAPRPTWRWRPAMAAASAVRSRETAVMRPFLPARCFGGGGGLGEGDTKSSERNEGQVEEKAMAASSSSSASEPLPEPSSMPGVAPWLLLLPRMGHLKFLREKEKEDSWGLLAMMVLMVGECVPGMDSGLRVQEEDGGFVYCEGDW